MTLAALVTTSILVAMVPGSAQALPIYTTNPVGNLSVVTPPAGPPVSNRPGVWADIPGLSTAAYTRSGGNLTATISAEVHGTSSTFVRALIDGQAAQPGDVLFKSGGQQAGGIRSFTFGRSNLSAGKHIVRMQWYTAFGDSEEVGHRSLSVNTAAGSSGTGRLVTTAAESTWIPNSANFWQDVPNLSRKITVDRTTNMKITFSAQTSTGAGRFHARALVDGVPTSHLLFEEANVPGAGARSFSFARNGVDSGTHSIRIQWLADGGVTWIADRTLSVYAAPDTTTGGGLVTRLTESPVATITPQWADVRTSPWRSSGQRPGRVASSAPHPRRSTGRAR